MAKFDPKKADLNKDGKLSDYEENVGKKRAAAMKMGHSPKKMDHSPMKKYGNGYAMKMGSKEIDSPSAFNMKDAKNIQDSPMMAHNPGHKGGMQPGTNYGYDRVTWRPDDDHVRFPHAKLETGAKNYQGISGRRISFNRAFKKAKKEGYDTFRFGYDKNRDGKITGNEVMSYTTKTKKK